MGVILTLNGLNNVVRETGNQVQPILGHKCHHIYLYGRSMCLKWVKRSSLINVYCHIHQARIVTWKTLPELC